MATAVGDVNGDSIDDIVVGAPLAGEPSDLTEEDGGASVVSGTGCSMSPLSATDHSDKSGYLLILASFILLMSVTRFHAKSRA